MMADGSVTDSTKCDFNKIYIKEELLSDNEDVCDNAVPLLGMEHPIKIEEEEFVVEAKNNAIMENYFDFDDDDDDDDSEDRGWIAIDINNDKLLSFEEGEGADEHHSDGEEQSAADESQDNYGDDDDDNDDEEWKMENYNISDDVEEKETQNPLNSEFCKASEPSFQRPNKNIKSSVKKSKTANLFKCKSCGNLFTKEETFKRHMHSHTMRSRQKSEVSPPPRRKHSARNKKCKLEVKFAPKAKIAKIAEQEAAILNRNGKEEHIFMNSAENDASLLQSSSDYCSEVVLGVDELRSHVDINHREDVVCHTKADNGEIGRVSGKVEALDEIEQKRVECEKKSSIAETCNENQEQSNLCNSGQKRVAMKRDVGEHMRVKDTGSDVVENCGGIASSKSDGEAPVDQCNNDIQSQKVRTYTPGGKIHKCSECGRIFKQNSDLHKHKRIHSGEKPYACKFCDARFSRSFTLHGHERTHAGLKPHVCGICNKSYSRSYDLNKHKKISHTGERPYVCAECKKSFVTAQNLRVHKRVHTGTMPFKCEHCGHACNHRSDLRKHLRTHTGEKPYCCLICRKSFMQSGVLRSHERIHHGM